jgi:ABC-type dipeptide/oligopeptide/nickel transport system permease subunit
VVILVAAGLGAVLAPLLAPADPDLLDFGIKPRGPTLAHPLGTDQLGRDHLSRLLHGGRVTPILAAVGTAGILGLGLLVGLLAGYLGAGWT